MNKIKVYELRAFNGCMMEFSYCGKTIKAEFKNGNILNNRKASVITSNPFVQDAMELDPRFGKAFVLAEEYYEEVDVTKTDAPKFTEVKKKGSRYTEVPEVKTINDAIYYFQKMGETVEDETKIHELIDHYKVKFPNLQ